MTVRILIQSFGICMKSFSQEYIYLGRFCHIQNQFCSLGSTQIPILVAYCILLGYTFVPHLNNNLGWDLVLVSV